MKWRPLAPTCRRVIAYRQNTECMSVVTKNPPKQRVFCCLLFSSLKDLDIWRVAFKHTFYIIIIGAVKLNNDFNVVSLRQFSTGAVDWYRFEAEPHIIHRGSSRIMLTHFTVFRSSHASSSASSYSTALPSFVNFGPCLRDLQFASVRMDIVSRYRSTTSSGVR